MQREGGLFLSVYVHDIKLAGKKQNIDPMWKVLNKEVHLGEPTSFFDHVYLGCTQRECQRRYCGQLQKCSNPRFLLQLWKNFQKTEFQGNPMRTQFLHGLMIWKVMQRSAWKGIVSQRKKQHNKYTKSQRHALMTTNLKKNE